MYPFHDQFSLEEIDAACERDMTYFRDQCRILFKSDEELLKIGFRVLDGREFGDQWDQRVALYGARPEYPNSIIDRIVYLYNFYKESGYMPDSKWNGPRWVGFWESLS